MAPQELFMGKFPLRYLFSVPLKKDIIQRERQLEPAKKTNRTSTKYNQEVKGINIYRLKLDQKDASKEFNRPTDFNWIEPKTKSKKITKRHEHYL